MWLSLLVACSGGDPAETPDGPGPLGIPVVEDGVTYAGASVIDVTPMVTEPWSDDDGNGYYSGGDSFADADGDGEFDAVWIGGFGPLRPATGVHDPVYARATVIARDGEYVAFVALDFVGLGHPRIWQARDALAADGFDPLRLIVSSSHNHQGPDTMGLWGDPLAGISGVDWAYQEQVAEAIEQAVRDAAGAMEPVDLRIGRTRMRDESRWLSGRVFGGKNPVDIVHGMIFDGRDPVVVSDQLIVLQGVGEQGPVFTLTNWSGHPEVRASDNTEISSDWVGVTREVLEAEYGGVALHVPESLGGMMSALKADLPLVLEDGTHRFQRCDAAAVADPDDAECFGLAEGEPRVDADGDRVPVWAERDSWEFVTSHGWLIAEAAIAALDRGEALDPVPLRVERERFVLPIENDGYTLLGPSGIFDMDIANAITDPAECPEAGLPDVLGCFEAHTFRLQLGQLGIVTVLGELLPELAWGFPEDDPRWLAEVDDPYARGAGAAYFPQHDPDCLGTVTAYDACTTELEIGDCDCKSLHAWPYTLSPDPDQAPLLDALDTEYRTVIGMADSYFSYIIPEPDFNTRVSLLTDDGDHYEDTVSPAHDFATRIQQAQGRISDRW